VSPRDGHHVTRTPPRARHAAPSRAAGKLSTRHRSPAHARRRSAWRRPGIVVLCVGLVAVGVVAVRLGPQRFGGERAADAKGGAMQKAPKGTLGDLVKHGVSNSTKATTALAAEAASSASILSSTAVSTYLASSGGNVTAAVYDEVTGTTSLYRPGVAEDTASIMKVDILATMLAQAQAHDTGLNSGQQELAQEMIEESDDNDAQDLWDAEGGATAVSAFNASAGLTETTPDAAGYWGLSTTTAADQLTLLKAVAFPNGLLTDDSRQYELGLMTHVDPDQAWGISNGVAPGATVAIKDGWLPLDSGGWQINSIGYVYGDGRNYLIAVLTNGDATESQGIDTIEGLSALVWQGLAPAA
jgi:hypothetical protein